MQRVFGYALSGDTSAHALFFLFGTGANGKSVTIDTVAGILNDYHRTAAIETFTASSVERHPTDLAGLRGARLVTAVETEEGRRWAESRIKTLTGGDKIAARFMRQDYFEFSPQFKLVIAGNHKPGLRSVDEAIRRRFHLIPFTVTIPPASRDPQLREKLKAELARHSVVDDYRLPRMAGCRLAASSRGVGSDGCVSRGGGRNLLMDRGMLCERSDRLGIGDGAVQLLEALGRSCRRVRWLRQALRSEP